MPETKQVAYYGMTIAHDADGNLNDRMQHQIRYSLQQIEDFVMAAIDRSRTDDGDLGHKRIRAVAAVYFFRKQVFCFEEDE